MERVCAEGERSDSDEDVDSGLNEMSVARFEKMLGKRQLCRTTIRFRYALGLEWRPRMPIIKELVINRVGVVIS